MDEKNHITHDAIVTSSIYFFSDVGFHKVTMDLLAEKLGCSKHLIYQHFQSKYSLFCAAARFIYWQFITDVPTEMEIRGRLREESPAEILRSYCFNDHSADQDRLHYYRLLYREAISFKKIAMISYRIWQNHYEVLYTALTILSNLGAIPKQAHDTLAEMWTRVAFVYSLWQTFDPYCTELTDVIEVLIAIAVNNVERISCDIPFCYPAIQSWPEPKTIRDQIIYAAYELYSAYGYNKTTIRQIAARISIHPSSIYRHFQNKWDVMLNVLGCLKCGGSTLTEQSTVQQYWHDGNISAFIAEISGRYVMYDICEYRIWIDMIYKSQEFRYHCLGRVVEMRIAIKNTIRQLADHRIITNTDTSALATIYLFNHLSINAQNAVLNHETDSSDRYRINSAILLVSAMRNGIPSANIANPVNKKESSV